MKGWIKSFGDMLSDMERGVFDKTDNGICTQCGACCSNYLPMTEKEIQIIHRYIKRNNIKECKHTVLLSSPMIDLTCPFLDMGKCKEKCRIYSVRPKICRQFICCSEKREVFKGNVASFRLVNVREEFFNENR